MMPLLYYDKKKGKFNKEERQQGGWGCPRFVQLVTWLKDSINDAIILLWLKKKKIQ